MSIFAGTKKYRYQVGDIMNISKDPTECRILVVGDIMLDKYVVGNVDRISPEAPVPVVNVFNEFSTLGGCGNVISNLRELGANVTCIARVGLDNAGTEIISKVQELGVEDFIVREPGIKTTLKERIVANHRMTQLVRVDRESLDGLDVKNIKYDFDYESRIEHSQDIIIISDYNKGVITYDLVNLLKATGIPIIADPKPAHAAWYDDVFMITPNQKEFNEIGQSSILLNNEYILRTLGRDGMEVMTSEEVFKIPSTPVDVYNVSGAGDTVVAVVSICVAMGMNVLDSAKIANEAARYVVQQPGTSTVPKEVFNEIVKGIYMQHYFKFRVPYTSLRNILQTGNYSRIIFYIDLPSIARGFYNADVVHLEIDQYISTQRMPELFFDEARIFYDGLLNQFKNYNPFFVTFYDSGKCSQNRTIYKQYKGDRGSVIDNLMLEDAEKNLFRQIKNYYFMEFIKRFNIQNLSTVVYTENYEADFIPYVIINNNWIGSQNNNTLNVILSTDKDLAQTCKFNNVRMCSTVYSRKDGQLLFYVLDNANAISYLYKKFKRGLLTAEYIPLILAIAGDKADNIDGVKGIGDATAVKLITQHRLPPMITQSTTLPQKLEPHRNVIMTNLSLTSFDEQLRRIPITYMNKLSNHFESIGGN